jgi:hypothetical protein
VIVVVPGGRIRCLLFIGLALLLPGVVRGGTILFVVAERPGTAEHRDSFVLPLTATSDVAHARDLIARGPDAAGAPIVFAEISAGADGVNRDVLAGGQPLWNWHVSTFEGFGDFGIELLDGNPTLVEADVAGWIANTRRAETDTAGHIGFWNYTVVAELDQPPMVPLPGPLPAGALGLLAIVLGRRWCRAPWRSA